MLWLQLDQQDHFYLRFLDKGADVHCAALLSWDWHLPAVDVRPSLQSPDRLFPWTLPPYDVQHSCDRGTIVWTCVSLLSENHYFTRCERDLCQTR